MRYLAAFLTLVVVVGSAPLLAQMETPPPLPGNVQIVPPGPAVSPRLAAFSGVWEGVWTQQTLGQKRYVNPAYGGRMVTIAIERIEPPNVVAVYAWGSYGGRKKGFRRLKGTISGETILLTLGQEDTAQVILKLTGDPRRLHASRVGRVTLLADLRKR